MIGSGGTMSRAMGAVRNWSRTSGTAIVVTPGGAAGVKEWMLMPHGHRAAGALP
jgi:hypothetical protein